MIKIIFYYFFVISLHFNKYTVPKWLKYPIKNIAIIPYKIPNVLNTKGNAIGPAPNKFLHIFIKIVNSPDLSSSLIWFTSS
jgi:hypothetical protein